MNGFYDSVDFDARNAYAMADDPYAAGYSQIEQTQEATQSQSQPQSQEDAWSSELWGFLRAHRSGNERIDFYRNQPEYTVGRSSENNIIFADLKISNKHCRITWDKRTARDSLVTVHDTSSNGTYVSTVLLSRLSLQGTPAD